MKPFFLVLLGITVFTLSVLCQNKKFKPSFSVGLDTTEGQLLLVQCSRVTPKNVSGFWKLSSTDIDTLESKFEKVYSITSKGCCGQGLQVHNLEKFGFQYIGVVIKGRRFIYINAFPVSEIEIIKQYTTDFDPTKKVIMVCDGGDDFWGILFDIKTKKFSSLSFNGEA